MELSILNNTKKILGIDKEFTEFDFDIQTHINAAFGTLQQLGVGPVEGFAIDGSETLWTALDVPMNQLNTVKSWLYLKVRMLFDPPGTSFMIQSFEGQIQQFEWRLTVMVDEALGESA